MKIKSSAAIVLFLLSSLFFLSSCNIHDETSSQDPNQFTKAYYEEFYSKWNASKPASGTYSIEGKISSKAEVRRFKVVVTVNDGVEEAVFDTSAAYEIREKSACEFCRTSIAEIFTEIKKALDDNAANYQSEFVRYSSSFYYPRYFQFFYKQEGEYIQIEYDCQVL